MSLCQWALLEVDLVTLFWTLSLQDLSCPSERYTSEIRRIKDRYALLEAAGSEGDKSAQRARRVEVRHCTAVKFDFTLKSLIPFAWEFCTCI